jgi:hypothetical protein
MGLSVLGIALVSAFKVNNHDSGCYHIQIVRWIEEYRVVPGLGNLHVRLAFNSSWSLLSALFNFRFLGLGPLHVFNGFFTLVFIAFMLQSQNRFFELRQRIPSIFAALLWMSSVFFILRGASSLDFDQPSALLLMIIFLLFLGRQYSPGKDHRLLDVLLVFLSVFSLTVKLSTLAVVLLPLYLLPGYLRARDWRFLTLSGLLVMWMLLPWLLRGVMLSGYLIYPFAALDLFNFDWKIPVAVVSNLQRISSPLPGYPLAICISCSPCPFRNGSAPGITRTRCFCTCCCSFPSQATCCW